jgi:hypothetical protein
LTEDGAVVQIYDGIWGYNSLLAMAAVSCVFTLAGLVLNID